jgi:hypothetical protein
MRKYLRSLLFGLSVAGSLAALGVPASAGSYYRDRYVGHAYHGSHSNVWYTSSCCYRKIVRHVRSVRYVRIHRHRAYYRRGYRRYYGDGYYVRPYRTHYHYRRPYVVRNVGYYDSVSQACYWTRVRVDDGRGGWVWGRERICN